MKTPEELAEEYVHAWWGPREDNMTLATRQSFMAGYQAAKDQFADTSKVMNSPEDPDSCEHILDMEKMVDVNPSSEWISVKDRLPEINNRMSEDVLILDEYGQMSVKPFEIVNNKIVVDWGEAGTRPLSNFTHWMPLPAAPKDEA
jgi:hypothetical protein